MQSANDSAIQVPLRADHGNAATAGHSAVARRNGAEHASLEQPDSRTRLSCTIGVMAYNEAANVAPLLEAVLQQHLETCEVAEVLVLSSGSTDDTDLIVQRFAEMDERVRLLTQPCREGKASAVNLFLREARTDIVVLESADTLPEATTIERMVAPFRDPDIGMTGARPVPVNDPRTFMGFAVHLLWAMHHYVACRQPKMGELIAFRRVFQRIPRDSAVDEASIEPLISGQGYQLRYVPNALVYMRGPECVADFLKQRRRIHAGHLRMRSSQGYVVSTMRPGNLARAFVAAWSWNWRHLAWTPGVIALEASARLLGTIDACLAPRHRHTIWDVVGSTKGPLR